MKIRTENLKIELSQRCITGSYNGYPDPYVGKFFYGFNNLDQAKEYANKVGGEVRKAEWKDGWDNCKLGGWAYEEFSPSTDDYPDDFNVIDTMEEAINEAYCIYNSLLKTELEVSEMNEDEKKEYEDEINAAKESGDNLIDAIANVNWEHDSVIFHCGDFYETVPKKSMVYNWDTRTVVIGVVVYK